MKMIKPILILIFCVCITRSWAQIDTIHIDQNELIIAKLKEGLHQYLVYFENPAKQQIAMPTIWNRQVTFKKWKGRDVIEVEQSWFGNDSTFYRYVYSICDRKTFSPMYHYTRSSRGVEAFDLSPTKVSGSDSVAANSKKDLDVSLTVPTLNWEVDLEVFNTLPIKKIGQRFIINFYHPGGRSVPAYYEYAVVGDDKLETIEGRSIDCWLLKINYSAKDWATFWIDKKSGEVLKMREFYNNYYRYKVRLVTPVPLAKN